MHVLLIAQLLALLTVANTAPLIVKKILGDRLAHPLDGGIVLSDGQPLFGRSKTIRGVIAAITASGAASPLVGLGVGIGVLMGSAAMAGDLISSFLKRRLRRQPSSKVTGLDQVPESLLPLVISRLVLPVSLMDILATAAIFFLGEIILAKVFFRLRLRDTPY
ncbi:MAG: CDP-archaeol synthase [Rhodospirillaceae bacterium]|nr:CDP-archaeol synthase [Rhodospirillaceae bacterium]